MSLDPRGKAGRLNEGKTYKSKNYSDEKKKSGKEVGLDDSHGLTID